MSQTENQVMLLQLAAAQLSISLRESEKPFNDLTKLFLEIVRQHSRINELLNEKPEPNIAEIHRLHKKTELQVKQSVVDFQFYDRMNQRLAHILSSMQKAILLLNDAEKLQDEQKWESIFHSIEKSYTMQEETELYEAIKSGEGFETAVNKLIAKTKTKEAIEPDIELF
ncbi:hypothetical protein [Aliikangiella maris]|uniref:Hemerythrin-like domain-containing protein n=2 Tax=Aliikangiella maris TaxID=3162458 RepID=A0ABV2BTR7_9GAMM